MAEKDDLRERLEAALMWATDAELILDMATWAKNREAAITTLREVLAHPERLMGEPVAWLRDRKYVQDLAPQMESA